MAIRDHHLRLDGSGYPPVSGTTLSRATQILLVVDAYEEIIHPLPGTTMMTPFEALAQMYVGKKEAFPQDVVVALVQTVGVYPPGTIVELSDGRQGLVVGVNPESRLRPLVLMYTERETPEPDLVDLAQMSPVTIVRSVPRKQLSPAVASYLNLNRWTAYFVHAAATRPQPTSVPTL